MFERTRSFIKRLAGEHRIDSSERRTWERFPSEREAKIRPTDCAQTLTARIQDLSRGGARLLVDRPIEAGTMVHVYLPSMNHDPHTSVLACVVHCRPTPLGPYALGCSFSTELSDTDLNRLAAAEQPVQLPRASERIESVSGRASYRRINEGERRRQASIHNISSGGVALKVGEEFEPGVLLDLELMDDSGAKRIAIVACVVYKSEVDVSEWLLGCNFVCDLDDEDLRALIGPAQ